VSIKYLSYNGILVDVILNGPPQLDPLTRLIISMVKSGKSVKDELIYILKTFTISQSIVEAVIEECIARNYLELDDGGELKTTHLDPEEEYDQQLARAIWDPYRSAFLPTVISRGGGIKTSRLVDHCPIPNSLIDPSRGHKRYEFLPDRKDEIQNELHPVTSYPNARLISVSDLKIVLNGSHLDSEEPRLDRNEELGVQGHGDTQDKVMTDSEGDTHSIEMHPLFEQEPKLSDLETEEVEELAEQESELVVGKEELIGTLKSSSRPRDYHLGTELTEDHHLVYNKGRYETIPLYAAIEYTGLSEGDEYNFLVNQSAVTPLLSESTNLWHHWRTDLNSALEPDDKSTLDEFLKELWYRQRADYQAEREGISVESRKEAEAHRSNACREIEMLIKSLSWRPSDLLDLYGEVIYNSSLYDLDSFQRAAMHAISQWIEIFLCEHVIKIPRFDLQRDWKAYDYEEIKEKVSVLRAEDIKFNPLFIKAFEDRPSDQHPREYLYGKLAPIAPSMKDHGVRMKNPKRRSNLTIGDSILLFSAALVLCEGYTLNVCKLAHQRGCKLLPLLDRLREDRNSLSHAKRDSRRELSMIIADIKMAWSICAELSPV